MKISKFSTALTIALSVVVVVSGVLLFFRLSNAPIHVMHEWLGMVFVAAIALHLVNHAKSMANHLKKPITIAICVVVLAASAAFYVSVPSNGVSAAKEIAARAFDAPIAVVAPLFKMSDQEFMDALVRSGFEVSSQNATLREITALNKTTPNHLITAIVSK